MTFRGVIVIGAARAFSFNTFEEYFPSRASCDWLETMSKFLKEPNCYIETARPCLRIRKINNFINNYIDKHTIIATELRLELEITLLSVKSF